MPDKANELQDNQRELGVTKEEVTLKNRELEDTNELEVEVTLKNRELEDTNELEVCTDSR